MCLWGGKLTVWKWSTSCFIEVLIWRSRLSPKVNVGWVVNLLLFFCLLFLLNHPSKWQNVGYSPPLVFVLESSCGPGKLCHLLLYGNNSLVPFPFPLHTAITTRRDTHPLHCAPLPLLSTTDTKAECGIWVGGRTDIYGPFQPSVGFTASALLFSKMYIIIKEGVQQSSRLRGGLLRGSFCFKKKSIFEAWGLKNGRKEKDLRETEVRLKLAK